MAVAYTGGMSDPSKVNRDGDEMEGELLLADGSPAASQAWVDAHDGPPEVKSLTETTGIEVVGRVVRVGPTDYNAAIPSGASDSAFVVVDKVSTGQDASVLFRSGGIQRAEIGLPGDNDLHIKSVTGASEGALTFTDAVIVKNASGLVQVPQGLGVGTVPTEKLHVAAASSTARVYAKIENTAVTGASRSAGFLLAGGGKTWYVVTDVGLNGGDNLGFWSETAGYPPVLMLTSSATVGIGTDFPLAKLDVNGSVNIRGEQGLTPLKLCGWKSTAGSPSTGTWTLGDVIIGNLGQLYICTTAGTPGTWTRIDHGGFGGLDDDDHPQYLNNTRGDARYSLLAHDHSGVYSPVAHTHGTRAAGTGTIGTAATSVAITHGLGSAPLAQNITITPTGNWGSFGRWWISAITTTTFTISVNAAPAVATATFGWSALLP